MYLISLIIPIYNAQNYLDDTINSIINQSIDFENIELILIDDFSTDDSKKIIRKYAKRYDNIIPYYSKSNHGYPGFGRNIGLKKATADYIMFMDNDDEIDIDFCKKLYDTINKENADVVCCDTHIIDPICEIKDNIRYTNGIETNDFVIIQNDNILLFKNISVWNKIFKKDIITQNDISFKENTYADDFIFTLSYFLKSEKLIYLKNYFGYKWNIKSDSLSHSVKKEHLKELINAYRYVFYLLKKENKFELANKIFIEHIGFILMQCSYLDENNNEIKKILKEIHDFEMELGAPKLNSLWSNTINYFVVHEYYLIGVEFLKITNKIRKLKILRKINRKVQ